MSFENELKQVFDIDIWQLKPQFSQQRASEIQASNISEIIETAIAVETTIKEDRELVYFNGVTSEKVIKFFIDESFNLNFLKNIVEKLFYESKVSVYYGDSDLTAEKDVLVINQNDFISSEYSLLSLENKKYVLEKLYQYADFKTH